MRPLELFPDAVCAYKDVSQDGRVRENDGAHPRPEWIDVTYVLFSKAANVVQVDVEHL